MIQFKKEGIHTFFSLEIENFDREDYIKTIKSFLYFLQNYNHQAGEAQHETYHVCRLIEEMLPEADQIISIDEIELFKQYKQAQKHG